MSAAGRRGTSQTAGPGDTILKEYYNLDLDMYGSDDNFNWVSAAIVFGFAMALQAQHLVLMYAHNKKLGSMYNNKRRPRLQEIVSDKPCPLCWWNNIVMISAGLPRTANELQCNTVL